MKKIAVITGANKGLGFETSKELAEKGYTIVLTARDPKKGERAVQDLKSKNLDVYFLELDVSSEKSIDQFAKAFGKQFDHLDVLINNAGIYVDENDEDSLHISLEPIKRSLETNVYGALKMCQWAIPLMKKNKYGRIVNLSSGMGQLTEMNGGSLAYRMSKTAINVLTRVFADELGQGPIKINSVCPGWVRTDMGGPSAHLTLEEGADTIVWLATLPDNGPTGGFFRERESLSW